MSKWLHYAQLTELKQQIAGAREFCQDYFKPINMIVLDNVEPLNTRDKATSKFFKLVRFNHHYKGATLKSLHQKINEYIFARAASSNPDADNSLLEFFETRSSENGWGHLDLIFKVMAGITLSEVIDKSNVLTHPDDNGLDGQNVYSILLRFASPTKSGSNVIRHDYTSWKAVCSGFEYALQLAQKAVDHHALKAQDFSEQERHLSQFPSDDRIHLHYTSYLVIMNNNEQVIMTPIEKGSDNGYIVDWSRIHIHHPTTSIISSMAAVASPRTVNMLKAKFLESELGL